MRTWLESAWSKWFGFTKFGAAAAMFTLLASASTRAQETGGGEANLKLPDLSKVNFLGMDGHKLLLFGIVICIFGLAFGLAVIRPDVAGRPGCVEDGSLAGPSSS